MTHFLFFSGVSIVEGKKFSILLDVNKSRYKRFSNENLSLIKSLEGVIKPKYKKEIDYLIANQWGHLTSVPEQFEKINLNYDSPSKIETAIIDLDTNSTFDLSNLLRDLYFLGCKAILIRYYYKPNINQIKEIYDELKFFGLEKIEIMMPKGEYNYLHNYPNIVFVLYGPKINSVKYGKNVQYSDFEGLPVHNCGFVNQFSINIKHYTESIDFNTCLNKKIGIDIDGNIKNCPSDNASYGNISKTSVHDVIDNPKFQEKWKINKNQIDDCKICEFRNVCTDCRVYTQNKKKYGKPEKCNYDPNTGVWSKNEVVI